MTYPEQLLVAIQHGWQWIGTQGDWAQPAVVVFVAWLVPWFLRTVVPQQWENVTDASVRALSRVVGPELALRLRKAIQGLPSLVTATALGVLVEGGDVAAAVKVAVWAVLSPIAHEAMKGYNGGAAPASRTVVRLKQTISSKSGTIVLLLAGLSLPLSGCAGSLVDAQRSALSARYGADTVAQTYQPTAHCEALSDRHARSSNWAQALSFVAGGSGVSTLPASELPEDYRGPVQYGAAGLSVAAGAAAAWFASDASSAATAFERDCLR